MKKLFLLTVLFCISAYGWAQCVTSSAGFTLCPAATTTLTCTCLSGGSWSMSSSLATVSSSGVVTATGSSAGGLASVTYTAPGGSSVAVIRVYASADAGTITGPTAVCVGSAVSLNDAVPGGRWASGTLSVATVSSAGVVRGVAGGTTMISYTVAGISGCAGRVATYAITVDTARPTATPHINSRIPCIFVSGHRDTGEITATPAYGTWWTSYDLIDSVVRNTSTLSAMAVYANSIGPHTVAYTISNGCGSNSDSLTFSLPPDPHIFSTLIHEAAYLDLCPSARVVLAGNVPAGTVWSSGTGTSGGRWKISDTTGSIARLSDTSALSATVTAISAGTVAITYFSDYCHSAIDDQYIWLTVGTPTSIVGATPLCIGATSTYIATMGPTSGAGSAFVGTWSSTATSVAPVDTATGVVTAVAAGAATISYSCASTSLWRGVSVDTPATFRFTAPLQLCNGSSGTITATYTTTTSAGATDSLARGGTWTCSAPTVATFTPFAGGASITATALHAGVATFRYTLIPAGGCAQTWGSTATILPLPDAGAIVVPREACVGGTLSLTDPTAVSTVGSPAGWSCSSPSIGTIDPTSGVFYGLSPGTATVTYTAAIVSGAHFPPPGRAMAPFSCGPPVSTTATVTVHTPAPAIVGPSRACVGSSITLTDVTSGGNWVSDNSAVATIDSASGVLTAVSAGTVTVTYYVSGPCGWETPVITITVNAIPIITGDTAICVGSSTATTGAGRIATTAGAGVWSISPTSVATISGSGVVTGLTAGTAIITYTDTTTGCAGTRSIFIDPPAMPIGGPVAVCVGSTITITDATTGGTWQSGNVSVATINATTGVLTGVSVGTTIVTYLFHGACTAPTRSITVNPVPTITGRTVLCAGSTTPAPSFSGAITSTPAAGATWTMGTPAGIATIDGTTGVVTGVGAGTAVITCTVSGCRSTRNITINPLPVPTITYSGLSSPLTTPLVACPASVLMLTAGGGVTYSWRPVGAWSGSTLASVTLTGIVAATTYRVDVTSLEGCVATASLPVTMPICDNYFCRFFTPIAPIYQLAGTIGAAGTTTYMPAGDYSVTGDVTFLGNVNFNNAVITIAPALTMNVNANAYLEFHGSHLFCCNRTQMWHGIVLQGGATSSGRMYIGDNSMIEDAETAVKIYNGVMPSGSASVFTSNGTVFNKNNIGVDINQFPAAGTTAPTPPATFPFTIRNSVFTSRTMENFPGYPVNWPRPSGTATALKAPYTPATSFMPPFNIINPSGTGISGSGYPTSLCNNSSYANIGISLGYVGDYSTSLTTPNSSATFTDVAIGENTNTGSNTYQNLFDNLLEGIFAEHSNLTCYNNAFTYMHSPTTSARFANFVGDGIGARAWEPAVFGTTAYPKYRIQLLGTRSTHPTYYPPTNNVFYDCERGVQSIDYYYFGGYNTEITSTQHINTNTGKHGFYIESRRYYEVIASGNLMTNVTTGISMSSTLLTAPGGGAGTVNQFAGAVNIRANEFNIDFTATPPSVPTGPFMTTAVLAQNVLGLAGGSAIATPRGQVNVSDNAMNYVTNGINITGYTNQVATSDTNTMYLRRPTANNYQYGIKHTNCNANQIQYNTISGPGFNVPTLDVTSYAGTSVNKAIIAIGGEANAGRPKVTCNFATQINVGYEFKGTTNFTTWDNNLMHDVTFGLVLQGKFGNQGTAAAPSRNNWSGAGGAGTYTGSGGTRFNTLTLRTPVSGGAPIPWGPALNRLFVTLDLGTTSVFDPPRNFANPNLPINQYGFGGPATGNGLNVTAVAPAVPACETYYSAAFYRSASKKTDATAGIEEIVTGRLYEEPAAKPLNWMAQFGLWNMMRNDASYADNSAVLAGFQTLAADSRYSWLTDIATAIANDDDLAATTLMADGIHAHTDTASDTATGVLMQDDVAADYIVQNYLDYYGLFLKYKNSEMTEQDKEAVIAIASLCPLSNGTVVYEAQVLYRIIYHDDTTSFEGNCPAEPDTAIRGSLSTPQAQEYTLYPNPNDGNFTLMQSIWDDSPIHITIQDAFGRRVYNEKLAFKNGSALLHIGHLTPGIYILQLINENGSVKNHKFVLQ